MDLNAIDQTKAVKYLLGELTEAEQAWLEERFFHDAALSEALSEAEDDLIDQYVRGEVSASDRERIEGHFLVSERRREKVKFARALLQGEQAASAPAIVPGRRSVPWWKSVLSPLLVPRPALSYSLAAVAFLFLVGAVWLFSEVRQLRSEIARLETERTIQAGENDQLRVQTEEQHRHGDELSAQKDQLEQQLAELRKQAGVPEREPGLASTFMTFILFPGSRGDGGPKKLVIPPGARAVRLQLTLSPDDKYPAYQVNLQTASGDQIRNWKGLRAETAKGARAIFVDVPAGLLRAGQYEATLNGVGKGHIEPLGYYYFSLLKD